MYVNNNKFNDKIKDENLSKKRYYNSVLNFNHQKYNPINKSENLTQWSKELQSTKHETNLVNKDNN